LWGLLIIGVRRGVGIVRDAVSTRQGLDDASSGLYGRYYDTIYSWRDYEDTCKALDTLFQSRSKPPRSLLDLGCGTGTHAVLLGQHGYFIVGIDSSGEMIGQAREKAEREHIDAHFVVADMRRFHLHRTFDAAFSLFSTFSYLTTDKDVAHTLSHVRSHLVPGGLLVFDAWCSLGSKTGIKQGYRVAEEGERRAIVFSETETSTATNQVALRLHCLIIEKNRVLNQFRETHSLRTFTPDEVKQHLEANGFRTLEVQLRNRNRVMGVVAEAI
jgi:SAM-dependent methyltransferase